MQGLPQLYLQLVKFEVEFFNKLVIFVKYLGLLNFVLLVEFAEVLHEIVIFLSNLHDELAEGTDNLILLIIVPLHVPCCILHQLVLFGDVPLAQSAALLCQDGLDFLPCVPLDVLHPLPAFLKSLFVPFLVALYLLHEERQEGVKLLVESVIYFFELLVELVDVDFAVSVGILLY